MLIMRKWEEKNSVKKCKTIFLQFQFQSDGCWRLDAASIEKLKENKEANSNLVQCKENYKKMVRNKIFVGFKNLNNRAATT